MVLGNKILEGSSDITSALSDRVKGMHVSTPYSLMSNLSMGTIKSLGCLVTHSEECLSKTDADNSVLGVTGIDCNYLLLCLCSGCWCPGYKLPSLILGKVNTMSIAHRADRSKMGGRVSRNLGTEVRSSELAIAA